MRPIGSARPTRPTYGAWDADPTHLREAYPAVASSVPLARRAITEFAENVGASDEQTAEIGLVASEALTNIVLHAYPARWGYMYVTARVAGGELWVLIADNGCGIHAGRDSDRLGVGLGLISQMSDGFSVVERSSGGTELRLRFVLSSAEDD